MRYKRLSTGDKTTYALIFDTGDEIVETMQTFARNHNLSASSFRAVGAFSQALLGFFKFSDKGYKKIPVNEQVEVLSLLGDIALYGDEPEVHMHVVLGKEDGSTIGGHLLQATAHPTLEVILEEMPSYLQRRMDRNTGLPLIVID